MDVQGSDSYYDPETGIRISDALVAAARAIGTDSEGEGGGGNSHIAPLLREPSAPLTTHQQLSRLNTKEFRWYHVALTIAGLALMSLSIWQFVSEFPLNDKNKITLAIGYGVAILVTFTCTGCVIRRGCMRYRTGPKGQIERHVRRSRGVSMQGGEVLPPTDILAALRVYHTTRMHDKGGISLREICADPNGLMCLFNLDEHANLITLFNRASQEGSAIWDRTKIATAIKTHFRLLNTTDERQKDRIKLLNAFIESSKDDDIIYIAASLTTTAEMITMCENVDEEALYYKAQSMRQLYSMPGAWQKMEQATICLITHCADYMEASDEWDYHAIHPTLNSHNAHRRI